MKRASLIAPILALAGALTASPSAGDSLSLVPADATTVGFVRVVDLRTNPFQLRIFEETDKISAGGDGARFLEEAGLNLRQDVDSVVFCTTSAGGARGRSLLLFEGRFDPAKLAAAVIKRGGLKQSVPGGDYFQLKHEPAEGGGGEHGAGAVSFANAHLVIAGSEPAVIAALSARANGGTAFASGQGLGRELHRVDPSSTAWILVDVERWRASRTLPTGDGPAAGFVTALKSVSLFTFQATVEGDALALTATGLTPDEETRGLLEDALRGLTAAWRMAAQEKSPELVAAIRKFQITHDGEGVTISGKLPGDLIRSLSAEAHKHTGK